MCKDIQYKFKIPSGSRPGPRQGPSMGQPGPAAAWYFVFISYTFVYLDTIGYMFIHLGYNWI